MPSRYILILTLWIVSLTRVGAVPPDSHAPGAEGSGSAHHQAEPAASVPQFGCPNELARTTPLPKIILNSQDNPSAPIDEEEVLGKVKKGECTLLKEGVFCGAAGETQKKNIRGLTKKEKLAALDVAFGFDDPFTLGMSNLMAAFLGLKQTTGGENAQKAIREDLVKDLLSNEYAREAWDLMLKTHSGGELEKNDPSEKAIIDFLSDIQRKGADEATEQLNSLRADHELRTDGHALGSVLKKWIAAYTTLATTKYKKEKFVPASLDADVKTFLRSADAGAAYLKVAVDWRNQFLAANIAQEYCKTNLKSGQDAQVSVSARNLPGLRDLLNRMSGGKVEVVTAPSALDQEMLRLTEEVIEQLKALQPDGHGRTGERSSDFPEIGPQYDAPPGTYNFQRRNPYEDQNSPNSESGGGGQGGGGGGGESQQPPPAPPYGGGGSGGGGQMKSVPNPFGRTGIFDRMGARSLRKSVEPKKPSEGKKP